MLFCDLVDATPLSASLDPEEWHQLVGSYQRSVAETVARFDGHIAQYLGDGLLVYFGWPIAHDDDAERAVRAGLAILEAVRAVPRRSGDPLSVRVGIHTGAVVLGEVGGEMLAVGEVPNVAARVYAKASPGEVLMTEQSHRLVQGLFVVEPVGLQALKGVPDPIALYRAVAPSGVRRLQAAEAQGLTPFVGREDERRLLASRWRRAREGEGQVFLIVGEAGIGKSRLLRAFRGELGEAPSRWIESACSPYHQSTPFYAVVQLLRETLGWRGDETAEESLPTIERTVAAAGLPLEDAVPLIAPLLGLPLPAHYPPPLCSTAQQRQRLFAILCAWVSALARQRPLVVVVEDLHWVDPSTLELLTLLGDQAATLPLMLLFTSRSGSPAPWPLRAHHAQIVLPRLRADETRRLVGAIATSASLPAALVDAVASRSDGVPLFAEELAKAVVEQGTDARHGIPSSLQDSLMARLDRLGPAKEIAQVGAVIGREFYYGLFHAVLPMPEGELRGALDRLANAELLYARGLPPDATYLFKHVMLQDIAYGSLLRSRRRALHLAVADALTQRFSAVADAQPETVAHHLSEAGESERAANAWQVAAERALARAALGEAASHYERALHHLLELPDDPSRAHRELGLRVALGQVRFATHGYAAPETVEPYARAKELGARLGDSDTLLFVLLGHWAAALNGGELNGALALADQLLALADRDGSDTSRIWAALAQGATRSHRGEPRLAHEWLQKLLVDYDEAAWKAFPVDPGVMAHAYLAVTSFELGYIDASSAHARDAIALADRQAKGHDAALAHYFAGIVAGLYGDDLGIERNAESCSRFAAEHGVPVFGASGRILRGWALSRQGRHGEAVESLRTGIGEYLATGQRLGLGFYLMLLAHAQARSGATDDALATIGDALSAAPQERIDRPQILCARGEILEMVGNEEAAATSHREAIASARELGAHAYHLRASVHLARILRSRGRLADARSLLADALSPFAPEATTADLDAARSLLADA